MWWESDKCIFCKKDVNKRDEWVQNKDGRHKYKLYFHLECYEVNAKKSKEQRRNK